MEVGLVVVSTVWLVKVPEPSVFVPRPKPEEVRTVLLPAVAVFDPNCVVAVRERLEEESGGRPGRGLPAGGLDVEADLWSEVEEA